jgi:hypothetical protein
VKAFRIVAVALLFAVGGCDHAIEHDQALPTCADVLSMAVRHGMPGPVLGPEAPRNTSTELSCVVTIGATVPAPTASPDAAGPMTRDEDISRLAVELTRPDRDPFQGVPVDRFLTDTLDRERVCGPRSTQTAQALDRGRICFATVDPQATTATATLTGTHGGAVISITATFQDPVRGLALARLEASTEALAVNSELLAKL